MWTPHSQKLGCLDTVYTNRYLNAHLNVLWARGGWGKRKQFADIVYTAKAIKI